MRTIEVLLDEAEAFNRAKGHRLQKCRGGLLTL